MNALVSWLRVALLDLRGGLHRFGVLIACVALGVGAIAAVGSVGAALQAAIDRDARIILGGDLEVSPGESDLSEQARAFLDTLGTPARVVELNTRAATQDQSVFVSLQAVSEAYPLLGAVEIEDGETIAPVTALAPYLERRDGAWGTLIARQALLRMDVAVGDVIRLGSGRFEIRGVLAALPDQAAQGFSLGVPALVSQAALAEAELDQPGVLTRYRYKLALDGLSFAQAQERIETAFPQNEWRVRSPQDATEDLERFFDVFARFLVLVGLSSLLVGGVGVSNAVAAYITERQSAIATLRSLGATRARLLTHFLTQIMVLGVAGVVIGLLLGAAASVVALPFLSGLLGIELPPTLDGAALATAAGFGVLIAFAFALLPLRRAQTMQPATLFRAGGASAESGAALPELLTLKTVVPLALAVAGIVALALVTTGEPWLVFWYAIGAVAAFIMLRLAAWGLQALVRRLPAVSNTTLRQAIRALHRPGAPAPVVILSLGLGLALLLMITLLDSNIRGQLDRTVTSEAPDFVVLDMDDTQAQALRAFAQEQDAITGLEVIPMVRGTIQSAAGVPAEDISREDAQGILRGDTPLSWAATLPQGSSVTEGAWWDADYAGPPLISLEDDLKAGLGLDLGDTLTIAIAGRPLDFEVANFRAIDWREAGFSFRLLASPGLIESAPQDLMGTIAVQQGAAPRVETALGRALPTLNYLPVGDVVARVNSVLSSLSNAVALVGSLAVVSGVLVLAGAISVGRRQREADAMVMKVLGATRRDVIVAFVVEYGVLGALAAVLAIFLGTVGAWAILTYVLEIDFLADPALIVLIVVGAVVATIATGVVTTWSAMSVRPAAKLRAEGL